VAIMRGPEPYTMADDPATPVQVVIHPGQRCTAPDGRSLDGEMALGIRTWGNAVHGATTMLVGTYRMRGAVTQRLLDALPTLIVLPGYGEDSTLLALLGEELTKAEPGQQVVLDRLLDLLLVAALRTWFSRPDSRAPGWYRALADPVVGQALRMLQEEPARPWTVASLAAAIGVSRAGLARRFTAQVGEPPMTFLANWRLALTADLLRDTDATIGAIARQVGYGSPFALSSAFKRVHGVSPHQHRRGAAVGAG
jgi:AraC-like DNA-binding protein